MKNPVLVRLLAQRQEQIDFISQLLEKVEADNRDIVDAERSNVTAAQERVKQLDAQIQPLEEWEATRAAHQGVSDQVRDTQMPANRGGSNPTSLGAQDREVKYSSAGEFVVDYLKARGQRVKGGQEITPDVDAANRVQRAMGRSFTGEERAVAKQVTGDTPGLLPVSIVGEILTDLDGSRPLVASVGAKSLGDVKGVKFNRPYISQHTTVGEQTAEKSELPSRKLLIDNLEFNKKTFGGTLNVSRQSIDWTDPSAWNAVITDLQLVYGMETEDWAATQLVTGLTQTEEIPLAKKDDLKSWIAALYAAAVKSSTAAGAKRASALRLPDTIWTSIDMWGSLGSMLSSARAVNVNSSGKATPVTYAGDILDIDRVVVPGLPAGSFVIGRKSMFEFYEERIGLLSAVEPSILGIEVAYGGYVAAGHLDKTAFTTVTVAEA